MAEPTVHPRQRIRDYVAALLTDAAIFASFESTRLHAPPPDGLPAGSVYTLVEKNTTANLKRGLDRTLDLTVDFMVAATVDSEGDSTLDDDADAVCLRVEQVLGGDPRLGGHAVGQYLRDSTFVPNGEGERRWMRVQMTYYVVYRTTVTGAIV